MSGSDNSPGTGNATDVVQPQPPVSGCCHAVALVLNLVGWSAPLLGDEIPYFARKYGVACSLCHVQPPKLNAYGESFRARRPFHRAFRRTARPLAATPDRDRTARAARP